MGKDLFDLLVYQRASEFRKRIWTLAKKLPKSQEFILVPQMRRRRCP